MKLLPAAGSAALQSIIQADTSISVCRVQVLAVSSAGAVFATMRKVPALTLAAWRLQLTTLLLVPGCIVNYRSLPSGELRN